MQLRSGVFSLDGDLRPPLAAPEVEEGGGEGFSEQVSKPPLCSLVSVGSVFSSAPWGSTQPASQPSSVAHRPHRFLIQL